MKKTLALLLAVLMLAGMLAACGGGGDQPTAGQPGSTGQPSLDEQEVITGNDAVSTGSKNGNVTMGPDSDKKTMVSVASKSFETLDPFFASGAVAARMRTILFDPLWDIEMGASEEVGICAKEWTVSDDGFSVDVTLYDNIHDWEGNNITADDFVWFYNHYLENKTLANLTSFEKTGDYQLRIGLKYAYYPGFLAQATQFIVAVSEKAYDAERFISDPVATGPYKCIDFTSGAKAVFMQTYDWWGDPETMPAHRRANVDVVEFQVITENSQIQTALETNKIQCADITVSMAEDFTKAGSVSVMKFPESYPSVFILNSAPGSVFDGNFALREAVAYACDWEALCQAATRGTGTYTGAFGNDSLAGYNKDWEQNAIQRDLDKAKEKLAEAGYAPGELTLRYVSNATDSAEVPLVLQANLADIGVGLDISQPDETQFLTTRQQANLNEWDILFYGVVPKGFMTNMLYTLVQIDAYDFGAIAGIKDQEAFDLASAARYSQDQADIDAAYNNIFQKLYYLPTWNAYGFAGAYSKIESIVKDGSLELIAQASLFADDYDVYYEG